MTDTPTSKKTYYFREENGRYYVCYLRYAAVETLFDIVRTREEAEKAIQLHKEGRHATQWKPEKN